MYFLWISLLLLSGVVGAWNWRPRGLERRQQRIGHVWVTQDVYEGKTFFEYDRHTFFPVPRTLLIAT
jgi:glycyl-tRNA synthetase (class II)